MQNRNKNIQEQPGVGDNLLSGGGYASQLASLMAAGRPAVCLSGLAWGLFAGPWGGWLGLLDGCSVTGWSAGRLSGLLAQRFFLPGSVFFPNLFPSGVLLFLCD